MFVFVLPEHHKCQTGQLSLALTFRQILQANVADKLMTFFLFGREYSQKLTVKKCPTWL